MSHIVVDEKQAAIISHSGRSVQVLDPKGNIVGYVTPAPPPEEVDAVLERVARGPGGPVLTTREVLDHLRSLEQL
jgi:hypothetical protein